MQLIAGQPQALPAQELAPVERARVNGIAMHLQTVVGDERRRGIGVAGQQDAGFLEQLAECRAAVGKPALGKAECRADTGIAGAVAEGLNRVVCRFPDSARKHVAGTERRLAVTQHQQDFELPRVIPEHDDG